MAVTRQTTTQSLHVLLVEDDPVQCHVLQLLMTKENHNLTAVSNGEDALVEATTRPPDIAIFDLRLPKVDGIELIQQFKNDPKLKDIPIIIASAIRTSDAIQRARAAGCDAYLTKPINSAELLSHIRQLTTIR